jgi:hypothetical protein
LIYAQKRSLDDGNSVVAISGMLSLSRRRKTMTVQKIGEEKYSSALGKRYGK